MADIQFPFGFDGTEKLPRTHRSLENCFHAVDRIIARPGITQLTTTGKVARGSIQANDAFYVVASNDLIKIDEDGNKTVIGTIAGTAPIDYAVGFNHTAIIVRGGKGYTLDSTDTLAEITSANFYSSNSVTHVNGRFVFVPSNGDPAFFSDVGNANSIQPASFFDAEELPDKNKTAFEFKNTLYIAGTDSIESFRDTGASPVPFQRMQNGRIPAGYIGGILEYNNTWLFIGRESGQDLGIYALSQGQAPKISNERIDTLLKSYSITDLENAISARFKWNGYDIACFTLPGHSFGFIGGNWFVLSTQRDDSTQPWTAGYITEWRQRYYTAYKDKIGYLSDTAEDYDGAFQKSISLAFETDKEFSAQSLSFSISQGFNTAADSVGIQLSKDGVLFTPPFYRDTSDLGEYDLDLEWNEAGGLGYYNKFMAVKLITTGNINFSGSKLQLETR